MAQSQPRTERSGGFFAVSKFRLVSTAVVVVMSIVALTPWSYATRIGTLPVINIMLMAIMFVGFVVLVIDLVVTREGGAAERAQEAGADHGE
ncbi:hypothetical protein [Leucobacter sp. USHLN154]|uniref:hypothetical protein n=1 Tax=Leucobacter sp. USHLN154 TaxID=3081269 RepID=UPI00301A270C